jgi:uncharacterized membrane protein YciS (DUF1049 family)
MKGLKIIPLFLVLIALTYSGMLFVHSNADEITVKLGDFTFPPTAVGFVVLTSIFVGMAICGVLCSIEMLALYVQNRRLKKKLVSLNNQSKAQTIPVPSDVTGPKASGRFT